jgi:predicted nucleic acid-binding protein
MGKRFLIDTNVVIDFSHGIFSEKSKNFVANILNKEPIISAITQIELLSFSVVPPQIESFVRYTSIIGINDSVIGETIKIRKNCRIKLPDAIIAATALVHDLTLLTRNITDFKNIENLNVVNPYEIK